MTQNFYHCRHCPIVKNPDNGSLQFIEMPELFAWLTISQANGHDDGIVEAFEDQEGEMIPCLVLLEDLYVLKEC